MPPPPPPPARPRSLTARFCEWGGKRPPPPRSVVGHAPPPGTPPKPHCRMCPHEPPPPPVQQAIHDGQLPRRLRLLPDHLHGPQRQLRVVGPAGRMPGQVSDSPRGGALAAMPWLHAHDRHAGTLRCPSMHLPVCLPRSHPSVPPPPPPAPTICMQTAPTAAGSVTTAAATTTSHRVSGLPLAGSGCQMQQAVLPHRVLAPSVCAAVACALPSQRPCT